MKASSIIFLTVSIALQRGSGNSIPLSPLAIFPYHTEMEVSKTDKVESYLRARGILSTGITHFNTLQMSVSHKKVKRAARTVKLEARKMHLRYLDLTDPKISNAVAKYLKDAQDGVYDSVNPFGALWTPE